MYVSECIIVKQNLQDDYFINCHNFEIFENLESL